jgi:hypothetical protein
VPCPRIYIPDSPPPPVDFHPGAATIDADDHGAVRSQRSPKRSSGRFDENAKLFFESNDDISMDFVR